MNINARLIMDVIQEHIDNGNLDEYDNISIVINGTEFRHIDLEVNNKSMIIKPEYDSRCRPIKELDKPLRYLFIKTIAGLIAIGLPLFLFLTGILWMDALEGPECIRKLELSFKVDEFPIWLWAGFQWLLLIGIFMVGAALSFFSFMLGPAFYMWAITRYKLVETKT